MLDSPVVDYLERIHRCDDLGRVALILERQALGLDLTAVACWMLTGPKAAGRDRFYSDNWPRPWRDAYERGGCLAKDALARWAISSGAPTTWTALSKRLPANDPAHEVQALARSFGYREAFVAPVRTSGGHLGLVTLHGDRRPLGAAERFFLEAICPGTLHRMEALAERAEAASPAAPLSQREQECASLLAQGLTNPAIAARLGISIPTVKFHLGNACSKLGARSRSQLAALTPSAVDPAAARGRVRAAAACGFGRGPATRVMLSSADGRFFSVPVEQARSFELPPDGAGADPRPPAPRERAAFRDLRAAADAARPLAG